MKFKKTTPAKSALCALFTSVTLLALSLSSCTKNNDVQIMNSAVNPPAAAAAAPAPSPAMGNMAMTTANAATAGTYTVSNVITLSNAHDITISGKSIAGGSAACIMLNNCYNITITGNKLYNSTDVGVHLLQCHNITVTQNAITNVSTGVYADHCPGGSIRVTGNQILNVAGPLPRGQFVQFNNVGGGNNAINNNICENVLGQSHSEDGISLFQSHGTAASPITINYNQIRGGGPSTTSGGIMLGDGGGSYLSATGNKLVDPGQYGIAISGGDHNTIANNSIYSKAQSFSNVGIYVQSIGSTVTAATVSGNKILFYNSGGVENDEWLAPGTQTPAGWGSNVAGAPLTAAILPATLITAL